MPPPSQGGGGAKYLLVLLILVAGGLGAFFAFRAPEPVPEAAPPVVPPKAERSTALANDALEIPEPAAPDAGVAVADPQVAKKPVNRPVGDQWACEGDVPATDIRRILSDSQTQVRSCYERRLRNNNMLQGTVNLQVKIGNGGKVTATRIRGTLQDAEVKACVQSLAKNWSFPSPTGGACAVFDAPYNFTPKN
jgi:outer membrane biosynthesis protein TonB